MVMLMVNSDGNVDGSSDSDDNVDGNSDSDDNVDGNSDSDDNDDGCGGVGYHYRYTHCSLFTYSFNT